MHERRFFGNVKDDLSLGLPVVQAKAAFNASLVRHNICDPNPSTIKRQNYTHILGEQRCAIPFSQHEVQLERHLRCVPSPKFHWPKGMEAKEGMQTLL